MIYGLCLQPSRQVTYLSSDTPGLAILRTCRAIHEEAQTVLYEKGTFAMQVSLPEIRCHLSPFNGVFPQGLPQAFFMAPTQPAVPQWFGFLKNVRIEIHWICSGYEPIREHGQRGDEMVNALKSALGMLKDNALHSLEIILYYDYANRWNGYVPRSIICPCPHCRFLKLRSAAQMQQYKLLHRHISSSQVVMETTLSFRGKPQMFPKLPDRQTQACQNSPWVFYNALDHILSMCRAEIALLLPVEVSDVQAWALDETSFGVPAAALDLPQILSQ